MKKSVVILLNIFMLCCIGCSEAQTQMEMNETEADAFQKADMELNKVYQAILSEYQADTKFVQNLKSSQRLWVQFRDAEVKMKYPEERSYYGSIHPVCVSNYLEKLTKERIATLNQWLVGIEEGNVCGGSVKIKDSVSDDTYLIQANAFYGLTVGDKIADNSLLTKDVLRTGEGDFDIYTIKNGNGEVLANVFPDPTDESKAGSITIISPLAATDKGIKVGMNFGDLQRILGDIEANGSEIEGRTSVVKDNFQYRLDANFWSYKIDQSKVDKSVKILEITIRR